jgi:hypothetical protein
VKRFLDSGAVYAGWVGMGMAATIAVSFLLVIPIEPVFWLLALPAGLLIGYYANSRSSRAGGPWGRLIVNGLYVSGLTAVTLALCFLVVKATFFLADSGYRSEAEGGPLVGCVTGADCVFQRYLAAGHGPALKAAGVTTVEEFSAFYWSEQLGTAGTVAALAILGGLGGAAFYGARARPNPRTSAADGGRGA